MVSETLQVCSGGLLLPVVDNDLAASPFNAVRFDLYVRNVAEFIDATIESRPPLLTHDEHGVDIHAIEDVSRLLKDFGKIVLQVGGMESITLFNRSKRRKNSRDSHFNIEEAHTEAVAGLKNENRMHDDKDVET